MPKLVHITTIPQTFNFFRGQLEFMQQHGFEIHAISSPGERLDEVSERENIICHGVEMPRSITPLKDLSSLLRMAAVLRRIGPDLVHAHTPKGGLLGIMAATLAGVPARIYHMRGLPMMTAQGTSRVLLTNTERISCGLSHRVVAVSDSLRRAALDERLTSLTKISVLAGGSSNGVNATGRFNPGALPDETRGKILGRFGIPAGSTVIGFIGRLVRDKGVVELANAWSRLRDEHPDVHLLVAGPWEPRDPVPREIRRVLEQDERVHLPGFVDEADMPLVYAAVDVVAFPSYREGFPNVPLEAAAMRIPVVSSCATGCVDAVSDGETGILVPVGDADSLAAGLQRYLERPDLRNKHGKAGRERVLREFAPQRVWEELLELYHEELARVAAK